MKTILLGATLVALGFGYAVAQTGTGAATAPTTQGNTNAPTLGATTPGGSTSGAASSQDRAAAGGDSNQAIATTTANATEPAKGANSFTEGEARSRMERNGFQNVTGLQKDDDGIWRGRASKDGQQVGVWLDYKGNVGANRM